ncbi:MAG TPA: rhodanese-like domain-containing protein [Chloroflexia bacterium]|nr:rhodanese-like domain-containing protein [Chloroflexia bacterium]HYP41980.1 rhodanese-like domain-containing protein [Chloroflexia bacterium]
MALGLTRAGYTNVKVLQGGLNAWIAAGGAVEP